MLVRWIGLWAGLLVAAAQGAQAQEAAFAGRWRITDAAIAPWAVPKRALDTREATAVARADRGVRTTFRDWPEQPCAAPAATYEMHDYPPDMIFEGALAEPDAAGNTSVTQSHWPAGLGMTTPTARTMELGGDCPEISYHLPGAGYAGVWAE